MTFIIASDHSELVGPLTSPPELPGLAYWLRRPQRRAPRPDSYDAAPTGAIRSNGPITLEEALRVRVAHKRYADVEKTRFKSAILLKDVDARIYRCKDAPGSRQVTIGFNGNGKTIDDMHQTWLELSRHGNVLAINLPGCGRTALAGGGVKLEVNMAANVKAALDYALAKFKTRPENITWYGVSLGATQAALGFEMAPGSSLILHNALQKVPPVTDRDGSGKPLARDATEAAILSAGLQVLRGPDNRRSGRFEDLGHTPNGLDTRATLSICRGREKGRVVVIAPETDELNEADYGKSLLESYYGCVPQENLVIVPGAHHGTMDLVGAAAAKVAEMRADTSASPAQPER